MLWHRSWFHKFIVLLLWIPKDICPDNSFPTTKCSKIKIPVFYRTKNKIRSKHLKNNWKKYHLKRKLDLYVYIYIFVHEITVFMFSIYIVCVRTRVLISVRETVWSLPTEMYFLDAKTVKYIVTRCLLLHCKNCFPDKNMLE